MRLTLAACLLALSIFGAAGADQINPAEGQCWDSGENQLAEGIAAYQRGDYSAAMRLLRPLADEGMYPAQSGLCVMYANGKGALQDYAQAATWCRKAADQGDEGAVHPRHDVLEGRR
jgi:TPR repeat protein